MANFTAAQARPPAPTGEVDNFVEFILHGVITNAVAFVGFIGNLGTIHIFRKHFYNTKLHLTTNEFFTETGFFLVKTGEFIFQHYIHFDKNFMLQFEIFST